MTGTTASTPASSTSERTSLIAVVGSRASSCTPMNSTARPLTPPARFSASKRAASADLGAREELDVGDAPDVPRWQRIGTGSGRA